MRPTESDVEQKLVWQLLTRADCLGIPSEAIATKRFLPKRDLGKGALVVRGFAPDYLVYVERHPVVVGEVKAPNETAERGYAEARQYASDINAKYITGINPVSFIVATNGSRLLFGPYDSDPTVIWDDFAGLVPGPELEAIRTSIAWHNLQSGGAKLAALSKDSAFIARHITLAARE